MRYRGDIDGLRAVAVLPVVFFHADFGFFNGGYLGVDVFFVISGFLITKILISEFEKETFSIQSFYERRARRILPALFFVLAITTILSVVFMNPVQLKNYSQSLVSVLLFISNLFFYFEIDYFSSAAEEMPLLHTWSLAIEEQFYLIFPPLMFALFKFNKRIMLSLLLITGLVSYAIMLALGEFYNQSSSFYWPVARAWELAAGALCALLIGKTKPNKWCLNNVGFILLLISLIFWPKEIAHPNGLVMLPVLATCFIILFPNENTLSHKVLTNRILVSIGLISYSLYLWHQPIFAFFRMKTVGHPSSLIFILAIFLSFLCAYVSYKFVETPFRDRRRFSNKTIFKFSLVGGVCFISAGLFGHFSEGLPERYHGYESYASDGPSYSPMRDSCHSSDNMYIKPSNSCTYPDGGNVSWAAFGDSHIVELSYAMSKILNEREQSISHHSYSGCPPALTYQASYRKRCNEWINSTLNYLEQNENIKNVLVGFRYSFYLYGEHMPYYPNVPVKVNNFIAEQSKISSEDALEVFWIDLETIIKRLNKSGKKVWLIYPIPELPMEINKGVHPFSIFNEETVLDLEVSTTKSYYLKRHEYILKKFNALEKKASLIPVDVYKILCSQDGCPAVIDSEKLYFDYNHLSVAGADIALKRFLMNEKHKF